MRAANNINKIESDKNNQQSENKNKHRSPMTPIQVFLLNCLIIVTVIWLMFGFILGMAQAPNGDMSTNIKANDILLYYRLSRELHAQDVVVLTKNNTRYIGRIVAGPGDTVDISDGEALIINGSAMIETNVFTSTPRYEGFVDYPVKLGENEYFILCDHRTRGEDSRYYGSVSKSDIKGKVITAIRRNDL